MVKETCIWRLQTGSFSCVVRTSTLQKGMKDNGFQLDVFHDGKTFSGKVLSEDLEEFATRAEKSMPEFLSEITKEALTRQSPDFDYELQSKDTPADTLTLVWKKLAGNGKMKFTMGRVSLNLEEGSSGVESLLNSCVDTIATLKKENITGHAQVEKYEKDAVAAQKVMKEACEKCEALEGEMMEEFLDILNGKKRKIVQLQEQIENMQQDGVGVLVAEDKEDEDTDEEKEKFVEVRREASEKKIEEEESSPRQAAGTSTSQTSRRRKRPTTATDLSDPDIPKPFIPPPKKRFKKAKKSETDATNNATENTSVPSLRSTRSQKRSSDGSSESLCDKME